MTNPYATAEETASVMRQATPDELWLEAQLERIAPNRFDADVGETDALIKLVFELKDQLPKDAPAGWKLVPVKPTPEMIKAGGHVNSEWLNDNAPIGEIRYATPMPGVYEAMLAAVPAAKGAE